MIKQQAVLHVRCNSQYHSSPLSNLHEIKIESKLAHFQSKLNYILGIE